ncbi:MAG: hypothetical protein V4545_04270 [Pseudomonadota bacterium]
MEILLNELSLHGQFSSVQAFQSAIDTVMRARVKIRQFGSELRCHRNLMQTQVTYELGLQQAVAQLDRNKRQAVMSWLTKEGPFWEDTRQHGVDDWLESQTQIVTDTGLGEAAYHTFIGNDYQTFIFEPSDWKSNPIIVDWHGESQVIPIEVANHWSLDSLENSLQNADSPVTSWQQLARIMPVRCPNLTFSNNTFSPLFAHPFVDGAAKRIFELLMLLDKFKTCFDAEGGRTLEGQSLYQEHFTGDKAWFSDSSDSEKTNYKHDLTFNHSNNQGEKLFCSWHGKVKTPQIRIHFTWPICSNVPLHVPYIGPKITKK